MWTTTPTTRRGAGHPGGRPSGRVGQGGGCLPAPSLHPDGGPGARLRPRFRRRRRGGGDGHLPRRRGTPAWYQRPCGGRRRAGLATRTCAWSTPRRGPTSLATVRAVLRPGDLCLTMGAGDLTTLADELLAPAPAREAGAVSAAVIVRARHDGGGMREMAPAPRHRYTEDPPVDPRFRRRWAEARRAEGRRRLRVLARPGVRASPSWAASSGSCTRR